MQLYIYDTDECIAHRLKRSPNLDEKVIRLVRVILRDSPYTQLFMSLGNIENIQECTIELNTSISVDQRRYNAPAMDKVAAIWVDGNDSEHKFKRSIVIYGKSNDPHCIRAYHGCYDPLAYPLFFPRGETGWEDKKIKFEDPPPRKPKRKYTKRKAQGNLEDVEKLNRKKRKRKGQGSHEDNENGQGATMTTMIMAAVTMRQTSMVILKD